MATNVRGLPRLMRLVYHNRIPARATILSCPRRLKMSEVGNSGIIW